MHIGKLADQAKSADKNPRGLKFLQSLIAAKISPRFRETILT
jgi:hypothetical protein